jgi:hypothetical protein
MSGTLLPLRCVSPSAACQGRASRSRLEEAELNRVTGWLARKNIARTEFEDVMDTKLLIDTITAGAAAVGSELVLEATRDAYHGLKSAVIGLYGRVAGRAIDKIEAAPGDASARSDVAALIRPVPAEEASEIESKLAALLAAFKADPEVKQGNRA